MSELVPKDELQAAIEARREIGAEMEPALIDSFVKRIEERLVDRRNESDQALKRKREHQKEMVLGAMGLSIPYSRSPRSSQACPASSSFVRR